MSESEIIKLPIFFIYARRGVFDGLESVETSITVGKTQWEIITRWEYTGHLHCVELVRNCSCGIKSKSNIKIDLTLFLKRNGSDYWRQNYSERLPESRTELHIVTNLCSVTFQENDILEGEVTIHDPEFSPPATKQVSPTPQLPVDLLRMLENPDTFADAKLKCGTTEIPVHKCILSARSPVFDAMFKNKMKESQNGEVDIEDMEPDVLQALLKYIYSGKSDHLTNALAGDLLFAADKYQLEEFKSICVDKLKKSTTVNNVVRILVLGHLLDNSLKTHATAFVCNFKKISELENTEGWKSLLEERPALAAEVLMAVVKNLQKC